MIKEIKTYSETRHSYGKFAMIKSHFKHEISFLCIFDIRPRKRQIAKRSIVPVTTIVVLRNEKRHGNTFESYSENFLSKL